MARLGHLLSVKTSAVGRGGWLSPDRGGSDELPRTLRFERPFALHLVAPVVADAPRRYSVTTYQTTTTTAKARIANTATTINPATTPIRSKTKCAAHGSERLRGPVSPIALRIQRRRGYKSPGAPRAARVVWLA